MTQVPPSSRGNVVSPLTADLLTGSHVLADLATTNPAASALDLGEPSIRGGTGGVASDGATIKLYAGDGDTGNTGGARLDVGGGSGDGVTQGQAFIRTRGSYGGVGQVLVHDATGLAWGSSCGAGITSGGLPTVQLVSGVGTQLSTTRERESHTPVTFNPGAATTATVTVELSPDNVTYSALAIITKPAGVVFDGEIEDVAVRVPGGWYVRLTVNAQAVLGATTYY